MTRARTELVPIEAPAKTLEQVLADALGELPVLRKHGQGGIADAIERLCAEVADATEDYRHWLSERDAILKSGKKAPWLRNHFPAWERQGLARWDPNDKRARQYRELIIPARTNVAALRADARSAARGEGHAA